MRSRSYRAAGVVQEQSEIKDERVLQVFEQTAIRGQFRIGCLQKRVELIDAKQGVLVGCVSVKELMLDQTSQLTEFRDVAAQKVNAMHQAQCAADFALSGQD